MKTLVVVQARMGSSRLPGKVLLPLAGRPLLERMLERLQSAQFPFRVCVATSVAAEDDPIRELCRRAAVPVVSGHPTDLLARHVQAGRELGADIVVKIPSDCPLIDPDVVDRVLEHYRAFGERLDFVTNLHPPSWPDGNDVEVVPMRVLETANREATRAFEREHTTPFIWERPTRFRLENVSLSDGKNLAKTHRFTIDYQEDYDFVARVYDELWRTDRPIFKLCDILALLTQKPDLMDINARWSGQSWHLNELSNLQNVSLGPSGLEWRSPN